MQCILDIETTLDHKTIRALGIYAPGIHSAPGAYVSKVKAHDGIDQLLCEYPDIKFVTWNGARFDLPILEKLWDITIPAKNHYDGMLLHKMLYPDERYHSLDYVSEKLCKHPLWKPKDITWYDTAPTPELLEYLEADLRATWSVWSAMCYSDRMTKSSTQILKALDLEGRVARMCQDQVERGVDFAEEAAIALLHDIEDAMTECEHAILPILPEFPLTASELHHPPKVQFKRDGTPSAHITKYAERYGWEVCRADTGKWAITDGRGAVRILPTTAPLVTTAPASLANQTKLKEHLITLGWVPSMWNLNKEGKRTSPRLYDKDTKEPCPNLKALDADWVGDLVRWLMLRSRKNVILSDKGTGWLPTYQEKAMIPSDADTLGANTARWTHRGIANVPRISTPYGKEMRSLFKARDGKVWVGWDASSLEAMCEAHYIMPYDPDGAKELCDGDPHAKNLATIKWLRDRNHAKTFKYGITYGAQPAKVATILGCDTPAATEAFNKFWDNNPGLKEVKSNLDALAESNGGWIKAIDGRWIKTRSPHSRLNALFQSAGAILMKYAMFIADHRIKEAYPNGEAYGLIRYHDEEIWECDNVRVAAEVGQIGCQSIADAAKYLGFRVPVGAEYKIGNNWAEVH